MLTLMKLFDFDATDDSLDDDDSNDDDLCFKPSFSNPTIMACCTLQPEIIGWRNNDSKKLKSDHIALKRTTKKERKLMIKPEKIAEKFKHNQNVICNCTKCMKISEKEFDRLISIIETKEYLLEFDDDVATEVEAHEFEGGTIINSKGNILKNRTKIRKETFNWSQRSATILFYLYPFFGGKKISLVCCIHDVKKGTLKHWVSNPNCMSKRLPFARMIQLGDITFSLPTAWENKYNVNIDMAKGNACEPTMDAVYLSKHAKKIEKKKKYFFMLE